MTYIFQFCIILIVCFIGEVFHSLIPLPIPASIYGLIIMIACLYFKIIKLEKIEKTADFLLQIMPLMFIPAAVGLISVWGELKSFLIPIVIIVFLTTIIVMAATGKITELVMRLERGKGNERSDM